MLCHISRNLPNALKSPAVSIILIIISNKIVIIITEHELAYTPMERCIEWRNNVECGAVCTVDENHVDKVLKVCRHRYLDQKPLQRAFTETY